MTLHGRIYPPSRWRILRDVRQWLTWTVRMMVVGLGLAGGLPVAHRVVGAGLLGTSAALALRAWGWTLPRPTPGRGVVDPRLATTRVSA